MSTTSERCDPHSGALMPGALTWLLERLVLVPDTRKEMIQRQMERLERGIPGASSGQVVNGASIKWDRVQANGKIMRCLCNDYAMRNFCGHVCVWLLAEDMIELPTCFALPRGEGIGGVHAGRKMFATTMSAWQKEKGAGGLGSGCRQTRPAHAHHKQVGKRVGIAKHSKSGIKAKTGRPPSGCQKKK